MLKTVHETFSQKFWDTCVCISSSEESNFNFNFNSYKGWDIVV